MLGAGSPRATHATSCRSAWAGSGGLLRGLWPLRSCPGSALQRSIGAVSCVRGEQHLWHRADVDTLLGTVTQSFRSLSNTETERPRKSLARSKLTTCRDMLSARLSVLWSWRRCCCGGWMPYGLPLSGTRRSETTLFKGLHSESLRSRHSA